MNHDVFGKTLAIQETLSTRNPYTAKSRDEDPKNNSLDLDPDPAQLKKKPRSDSGPDLKLK